MAAPAHVHAAIAAMKLPISGFDEYDAAGNVADTLTEGDCLAELVEAVAGAKAAMHWIAANADIPPYLLGQFRALDGWVTRVARMHADECEALGVGEEV